MRLAVYSLAAIMVAGLAVGIAFSNAPVAEVRHITPDRGTVYVDSAVLMTLHPSWQALGMMKSTLADMGIVDADKPSRGGELRVSGLSSPKSTGSESVLREKLREESVRETVGALSQLEMERRQALQSRLHSMRADMIVDEERKLKLQSQEAEAGVSEQLRVVAVNNSYDQINARLRLSALKGAEKTQGVDSKQIDPKIDIAQSELDHVTKLTADESDKITAQAAVNMDRMSSEAESKINATLDIYERGENRRIESQMAVARDQILSELNSHVRADSSKRTDVFGRNTKSGSAVVVKAYKAASRTRIGSDAAILKNRIVQIEASIKRDVARAARTIAEEKGVKVVFTRRNTGYKDRTDDFARSLRKIGWGTYEPVMLSSLGS